MSLRIDLTDRHEQHSEEIKAYVRDKVGKLAHYFDKVQSIEVVLDHEHDQHSVEVIVTANRHMHFIGHASDDAVMTCVDRVVDKLERQVIKAKERLKDHHRGDSGHKTV